MAAVDELLDKVKESCSLPSDMALATKMGIQRQLLSKARMGDKPLSDERIAQLCAMAKLDGGSWMARIHAERAGTPAERALWRSVLDRLSAAAAVVALVVLAVHTGAHEGLLTALSPLALTAPSIHYAKWRIGRHDREFVWSAFGSSLACQTTPLAKRNSQH
ncbi:DUF3693 domain-containing protein [Xanthomonas campestris pv. campestris]|nr:DUF3693 domain-containing protein [Xanthomonas campestris]MCC5078675.1 DUF3693 domain-containing protein [Xanthomonas campestris pv. campestris]MDO0856712.1 DUF3693 domain-containing protein [Xanthomonas campestris pv. campestris]MEA0618615.1 DUF3693 domain-containing protein [Xanthomonas campestris pv. campestris]MEA0631115.1 DUF3693 domain-containing protein [Xanthomonas campestris pv. campestris]MEA0639329.1 DUF3693 domain-containing protein [Xanthomonas campestris pv. campestris]